MGLYTIAVENQFSSAHRLPDHTGKCKNLHGHNWRVRVTAGAKELSSQGMVVDFADLKNALAAICGELDHRLINELPPFTTLAPTAENLSREIWLKISKQVQNTRVKILEVEIWETETNLAKFIPDEDDWQTFA